MSYYHGRMLEIMRQREQLLAQCDVQRAELVTITRQSEGAIKVVDRVVGAVNYFRSHPVALGVAVALLVVMQRRGLWGWARRGFILWRAYRAFGKSRFTV